LWTPVSRYMYDSTYETAWQLSNVPRCIIFEFKSLGREKIINK
jgi:hypothetical protein